MNKKMINLNKYVLPLKKYIKMVDGYGYEKLTPIEDIRSRLYMDKGLTIARTKYESNRKVKKFEGSTLVSFPEVKPYQLFDDLISMIKKSNIGRHIIIAVPNKTEHLTVQGIVEQNRWRRFMKNDGESFDKVKNRMLDETTMHLKNYKTTFKKPRFSPYKISLINPDSPSALVLSMLPQKDEDMNMIRNVKQKVSPVIGRPSKKYIAHITLGYIVNDIYSAKDKYEDFLDLLKNMQAEVNKRIAEPFTMDAIHLWEFDNMTDFDPSKKSPIKTYSW